ncbi:hypothetical protein Tco_0670109 [Tanacetum coccineum]
MSTQQDINAFRTQRLATTHDPLALMANTQTSFHLDQSSHITYIQHPQPNNHFVQQPSFNTNYMQQPMQNPKDSSDPTTAMNMALALIAKAFKIAQPGMNTSQDIKMQMVDDNVGNQVRHNAVQNDGNEVGQNAVQNLAPAKGNGNGINDAAYLQQQLQFAQEEEVGIQSNQEEFEFMDAADSYEETERVKVNCTLEDTLQQASTSGTQSDSAPVYDSDGSTEVPKDENCYDHDIFNMLLVLWPNGVKVAKFYMCLLPLWPKLMNIGRQLVNPAYTTIIEPSAFNISNRKWKYTASCSGNLPAYDITQDYMCQNTSPSSQLSETWPDVGRPVMINKVIPHAFPTYEIVQQSDAADGVGHRLDERSESKRASSPKDIQATGDVHCPCIRNFPNVPATEIRQPSSAYNTAFYAIRRSLLVRRKRKDWPWEWTSKISLLSGWPDCVAHKVCCQPRQPTRHDNNEESKYVHSAINNNDAHPSSRSGARADILCIVKLFLQIRNLVAPPPNNTCVPFGASPTMCPGIELMKMETSAMIHFLPGIIIVALLLVNESVNGKNPTNPSDFSINSSIGNAASDASLCYE